MLINTSRGGLIDTRAAIEALKSATWARSASTSTRRKTALFFEDHPAT